MKQKKWLFLFFLMISSILIMADSFPLNFDRYHTPDELNQSLKKLANLFPRITKLHKIAISPGGRKVMLLEIGPEVKNKRKKNPAILVVANMSGTVPISSEGAMKTIQIVLDKEESRSDKTWYICPVGNPDALNRYFSKPLAMNSRNSHPHNDDMDDQLDEDGTEDLDGNGIISMMRVKSPEGKWIPIPGEPRMMKKADWSKGEKGLYKVYVEGIDNDGDGQYNEDGPGGVDIAINFPHLFKFFKKTGGAWAGSETESFNLIKFIFQHPEIALTFCLGETNFCLIPPRGGRKGTADFSKIKIPERVGKMFKMDVSRTYTIKEIIEIVTPFVPEGFEITESMVASFLGLGAMVNPLAADLKFYNEVSEKYKEFLKKNKMDSKRLDPPKAKDGSFELWSYYHLGLPSFSLDFWTLPQLKEEKKGKSDITPEKLEKMSNEEFLALGEEKIDAFLKSSGAPANVKAKMIMNAVKNGMMTTKKMTAMLRNMPKPKSKEGGDPVLKALLAFSDKELKGKGFMNWKPFQHKTLGKVELGGAVPYSQTTPPAHMINQLIEGQVPWILHLAKKIARIKIVKSEVKSLGNGLFRLKIWIENRGYLPYPTEMGKRNNRVPPIVVTIEGENMKIIEGKKRSLIKGIAGTSNQVVNWILYSKKPGKVKINAFTPLAWADSTFLNLGGSK